MLLRQMEPGDLDAVGALVDQLGYEAHAPAVRAAFSRVASDPEHLTVVAVDEGRIVGWVHAYGVHLLYVEPFAEIGTLVVDDSRRGEGVGRALMVSAENWARGAGYAKVRVRSRLSRGGAHRFYVRLGYEKEKAQYTFARRLDRPPE
jgi:predicted N-acetyltransferase YhbS